MCFELAFESNPRIQTILGDPAADSGGRGGGVETGTFHEQMFFTSNFSWRIRRFPRPNYPPLGLRACVQTDILIE